MTMDGHVVTHCPHPVGSAQASARSRACLLRVFSLLLLCFAGLVQADESGHLAARAMELSGTRETLEHMGEGLARQMATDPRVRKMGKQERAELSRILHNALDGHRMADELTAALAATQDAGRLRASVSTMEAPEFQKVVGLSLPESLQATDQEVVKFAKGFVKRPPDP